MHKINRELTEYILHNLTEEKKKALDNALTRNLMLTSSAVLSSVTLTVYKEGWNWKFEGTRCSFSVYAKDNDGELEITRKPNENKLHKLYEDWGMMNESDFRNL